MEYKVKITLSSTCEMILQAYNDKELQEIVKEALERGDFNFSIEKPSYKIEVKPLG